MSIAVICMFQQQIKELERSKNKILAGLIQIFVSIPGLGPIFAAPVLLIKLGKSLNTLGYTGERTNPFVLQL